MEAAVRRAPQIGGQRKVTAVERAVAGKLPSTDERVQEAMRPATDRFALTKRKVHNPVPLQVVLGNCDVPLIVFKTVQGVKVVCRNRVGQPDVRS